MPVNNVSGGPRCTAVPTHERCYTVRSGETLSGIAYACRVRLADLLAANPQISDPNKIFPGMELKVPTASTADEVPAGVEAREDDAFYMVRSGDSLSHIASRHNLDLQTLIEANPQIRNPNLIQINDRIRIPGLEASSRGALGAINAHASYDATAADATRTTTAASSRFTRAVYAPNAPETIALFEEAARTAGVPTSWARSPGLHKILDKESDGRVGVPNFTYGSRASNPSSWPAVHAELRRGVISARSSCTGLGQLRLDNVDAHYPDGRAGIGDPLNEAAGMLSYIKSRYGDPDNAWRLYGVYHQGY